MKLYNKETGTKREELESKINDAADGLLDVSEIRKLEEGLALFPDLHQEYLNIINLPDLSAAYRGGAEKYLDEQHLNLTRKLVQKAWEYSGSFDEISVNWFKKYALAASFLIFGLTSLTNYILPYMNLIQDDITITDFLYPYEESYSEAYVIYLDELIEE